MLLQDKVIMAGIAAALALAGLAAWVLVGGLVATGPAVAPAASAPARSAGSELPSPTSDGAAIVIDVEGAVAHPGIRTLPASARIADAIAAAGGYAPDADLGAAAHTLNLAAALADGDQVYVPRLGEATGTGTGGGSGGGSGGSGLVDLNQATPEQLDALPGIGPVTVQKIVAARTEQPFTTLDELVTRKVMTSSQLDGIRDLVTV